MEKEEPKELPSWDELMTEQKPAIELFDDKEHVVVFLNDKPIETQSKKFKGKKVYLFSVEENQEAKTLIVTSLRLAVKLKALSPLKSKVVTIKGVGKSTDRDYEVAEKQ